MRLRVLIAPSGFKESLTAEQVAAAMCKGVKQAMPDAECVQVPMVDGGEGFTKTLVGLTSGHLHHLNVTGPVAQPVQSHFGFMGGKDADCAVLEMAAAAGLRLVPRDARDPRYTTSYGVGELIRAALDHGARRILLGCGDSGINDGGAGMAQALGVGLLDERGEQIGFGGIELQRLRHIDMEGVDPRLAQVQIDAAVNWHNVLLGSRGVARVFGPQKGATPEMVEQLDAAMENYAAIIKRDVGLDVGALPGSGASGGLGTGLMALLGGVLHPRYEIIMRYIDIDRMLENVDLVLTAEGSIDGQTPYGKVPGEIARRAQVHQLPVFVLAGTIGTDAALNIDHGVAAYFSIARGPCTLQNSIEHADELLIAATEQAMRTIWQGFHLAQDKWHTVPEAIPEMADY